MINRPILEKKFFFQFSIKNSTSKAFIFLFLDGSGAAGLSRVCATRFRAGWDHSGRRKALPPLQRPQSPAHFLDAKVNHSNRRSVHKVLHSPRRPAVGLRRPEVGEARQAGAAQGRLFHHRHEDPIQGQWFVSDTARGHTCHSALCRLIPAVFCKSK